MLLRFSLYGFLKNQQYFEPFLVLVFLEKGLTFLQIGLLIAFRELIVNLFEIPSGALADLYGRRRAMILSFGAYIASFALFGLAESLALLILAMFLFGIGVAFRTGTHKAIIFTWLRMHGRIHERTRFYGMTRSWSKVGSAVSVVLGAALVLLSDGYVAIFYVSILPYLIGIANFLGYPRELDSTPEHKVSGRRVYGHLRTSVVAVVRHPGLRRLMFESMGYGGVFRAAKDYLQPVLKATALAMGAGLLAGGGMGARQQVALLVGPVYFLLFLLSAAASRQSHKLAHRAGGEDAASRRIWVANLLGFVALLPCLALGFHPGTIVGFVYLYVLQNAWRPILVSRFDKHCDERQGATILSIESQARTLTTMVVAPLMGVAVDLARSCGSGGEFWPVAAIGAAVALGFVLLPQKPSAPGSGPACRLSGPADQPLGRRADP